MNSTVRYYNARARMYELGFTTEQRDFIFADRPNEDEHISWLLTASKEEIEDWGAAANWGRDGKPRLKNATPCYLEIPWNGVIHMMRWGDIKRWARKYVHERDRDEWLREARRAAVEGDSKALGAMILGS